MIVPMKTDPPITEAELRAAIEAAGSPEKAAPVLEVSRRTVYRWMDHYGIKRRVVLEERPQAA
jgi:transcriptional regulator of acetoin/glycerol metabolism